MRRDRPLLAFFGHHKCASRWINDIVKKVCYELALIHVTLHNRRMFGDDLRAFVEREGVDFLAYTNAKYECVLQLKDLRGFHVVRDPRDISVSAYFSHLKTHDTGEWPDLVEHREKLQSVSKRDGLLLDMKFMKGVFNNIASWDYTTDHVMEIKMEELAQNPYVRFLEIFRFLGLLDDSKLSVSKALALSLSKRIRRLSKNVISLPRTERLSYERILAIISDNDFGKKTGGRLPGIEDRNSHYRKGVAGDWRNHFEEEHIEYFRAHYNKLLINLGYESNPDWS